MRDDLGLGLEYGRRAGVIAMIVIILGVVITSGLVPRNLVRLALLLVNRLPNGDVTRWIHLESKQHPEDVVNDAIDCDRVKNDTWGVHMTNHVFCLVHVQDEFNGVFLH